MTDLRAQMPPQGVTFLSGDEDSYPTRSGLHLTVYFMTEAAFMSGNTRNLLGGTPSALAHDDYSVVAEIWYDWPSDDPLSDALACEAAWSACQNIDGSWSRSSGTYDSDAPGQRSMMVGDAVLVRSENRDAADLYVAVSVGFKPTTWLI